MPYECLGVFLRAIAGVPDHKYVLALDAAWCLGWTAEDDLYFSLAPHMAPMK